MEDKDFIVTSDLTIAASLYCLGVPIKGYYAKKDSDQVDFYIEKTPENESRMRDYYAGKLKVNPQEFLYVRKELLNSIKNEQNIEKPIT